MPKKPRTLFSATEDPLLEAFFAFRCNSIARITEYAAGLTRAHGLSVGLDCFSPTLTHMVGQDLCALNSTCDWIKIMTYPRVLGPAGLPFELGAFSKWLSAKCDLAEAEAIHLVTEASGLPFSMNGLGSGSIAKEIRRGRAANVSNLLVGIALVQIEGIHDPTLEQIQSDLAECHRADGLVLSWDLWHIPSRYISAISKVIR